MKINKVEELLNTPRANIRYYEKEELITVSRKETVIAITRKKISQN